jgi:hypothetical protein
MYTIKCEYCNKDNIFNDSNIRESGTAKFVSCRECRRTIFVESRGKKYYKKVVDK